MAMDNPSYFTIPGTLNSRASFSLRHGRMASSSPPVVQRMPEKKCPSSPTIASGTVRRNRTVLAGAMLDAPFQTQMLVLGMPRACDVAPQLQNSSYSSSSDLHSYCNIGTVPPSRRHSIGAFLARKQATLPRKRSGLAEEVVYSVEKEEVVWKRQEESTPKGMEDIIIISSQKSQAADLWVSYLKTCFEQIRKNRSKLPFRILSIAIEDIEDRSPMSLVLETKLRQARLEIVILCPAFLDFILQYPERSCKLTAHLQAENVLAMLLGLEEKSVTEEHRAALVAYNRWRRLESVKDRDEKFVNDFLAAAMEILAKTPVKSTAAEKSQFMLIPKKVNHHQKKVVVVLTEPFEKADIMRVSIVRNGADMEVPGVVRRNPYTLAFRVPDEYLGFTCLVSVRVSRNGREIGSKLLKCESQLHALEQVLRGCDQPIDFICQAFGIVPADKAKLDETLLKAFQRNVPVKFNLLQSTGLGDLPRGAIVKEEFPTLLHFAAKYSLEQLCWALLECPGGDRACEIKNVKNLTPAEIAEAAGHKRLSNLLSGYMQMSQFSSAYAFLKGIVDGKSNGLNESPSEEYLSPRPFMETYQVPPSPRPCPVPPPTNGYMPMKSALGRIPAKSADILNEMEEVKISRDRLLFRSNSDEAAKERKNNNAAEEELIEIISDFKNNVFTISEVEALVNQWRRRNDVQQSFREKQEHLTKLREEYEKVQQRMKDGMGNVNRPSPMERIRSFFRGKGKAEKKKRKEEGSPRPASSLSTLSLSSGSSSGRLSTTSGGSLADAPSSDPESRFLRPLYLNNYDIPPSPVSVAAANHDLSPGKNYDVPPHPVEVTAVISAEYCNLLLSGEYDLKETRLSTVAEEVKKTDSDKSYINLPEETTSVPEPLTIIEQSDLATNLPEYVNVETQGIQLKCS